jgi:YVTN family beta-propeller protein
MAQMVSIAAVLALGAAACGSGSGARRITEGTVAPSSAGSPTTGQSTSTSSTLTTPSTLDAAASLASMAGLPLNPAVPKPVNVYAGIRTGMMSPAVADALPRVYVPNLVSNTVTVIDPATYKVIGQFAVGRGPQHVVPSWDLSTLWVTNNAEGRTDGSLTPIDPKTGKPGAAIKVDDPYNMYFTPDGSSAIVVAEARRRLDFRDPHTMQLQFSVPVTGCAGVNHADFAADGTFVIFTCEFGARLVKVDLVGHTVAGYLGLGGGAMPQDIRISPDGTTFYVADMATGGVHIIDGATFTETTFLPTGVGTHGLYPSRDGTKLYIANRGSSSLPGSPLGQGSVSVLDFATKKLVTTWPIPGGGSPDMGNVSVDGRVLWLSGRYDGVVYAIDTTSGAVLATIPVGREPHGLTVWPQPGTYSLGHTGNMR